MNLNKEKIIEVIKKLNLPIEHFSVLMGAALVLLGIKEYARDIDLGATPELFESLVARGYPCCSSRSKYAKIKLNENVYMYKGWLPEKVNILDDVTVADIQSIISDKKQIGRLKDFEDIKKITDFMNSNNLISVEYFQLKSKLNTLRGMYHIGMLDIPVLIVHGYLSSNKIGPHRLYVQIAHALSQLGYRVLRIDLSGMGESDGDIYRIDFNDHVYDLQCAMNEFMDYCGSSKIHLIGHCIGACTILSSAFTCSKIIESITFIAPFIPSRNNYIRLLFNEASYNEIYSQGHTIRNGLICRRSFIDAGYIINCLCKIKEANIDLFAYFSSEDEMVDINDSNTWAVINNVKNKVINHANHNILSEIARNELLNDIRLRFDLLK